MAPSVVVPLMVFTPGPLVIRSLRMHVDTKSEQPIEHPGSLAADAETFSLVEAASAISSGCLSFFSSSAKLHNRAASSLKGATQISFDLNEYSHTL